MTRITQIARGNLRTGALALAFTLTVSACASSGVPTESSTSTTSTMPSDVAVATPTTGAVTPPEPPKEDAIVTLEWTEAGLSGEVFIDQLIATDHGFVAYRFAHGSQAWESENGIDWIEKDLVLGDATGDLYLNSITAGGPGYLALGATFDDDDEVLWTSEDGFTWRRQAFDLEYPPLGEFAYLGLEAVAGGSEGLVLTGRMDPRDDAPDVHRFVAWTSADGSAWDLVEDPFGPDAYIGEILPIGDGFVTQGFIDAPEGGEYVWLSTDGRAWDRVAPDFLEAGYLVGLVRWGDKILSAVQAEDGIRLWASSDGRDWEQLPSSPMLGNTDQGDLMVTEVAAGPLGIVLIGELEPPRQPEPPVVLEKDGLTITFELETFRVTVADAATGVVLLEAELLEPDTTVINDDDSLTFLHPDTGEALVTVTPEEFEEARKKAFKEVGIEEPGFEEPELTPVLFFSPDGQRWTRVEIEEIVGSNDFPSGVVVGTDAVILRFSGLPTFEGEEPPAFIEDEPDIIWVGRLTDGQ